MKRGLYTLTLPFLWLWQVASLLVFLEAHVAAAPVRAFIYWGRSIEANPGWRQDNAAEIGVWCHRPCRKEPRDA
jgi:hypothetical protein